MVGDSDRAEGDDVITVNGLLAKQTELPRLTVKVGGETLSALVDSGSAATLMSTSVWKRSSGKLPLKAESGVQLRSVTGGVLCNRGQIETPIEVGKTSITHTLHVIDGLPYDVLLGIDFIRTSRMVLNAAEGYVRIGTCCVPFASSCGLYNGPRVVSLARAVRVPAGQVTGVPVRVDSFGKGQAARVVEFKPVPSDDTPFPQLEVPGMIAETNQTGQMLINVCNPTETDVKLPAGYVLGQSELYEGVVAQVQLPNSKETSPGEEGASPRWAGRWPSREAFLDQFPLDHLKGELRIKVENLLCQYEAIFASHDYDLGRIQIAAHTIRLKPGAEPVHSRPYPCSEHQRQELHRQLEEMLKHDLIRPAYDGFTSPCILVKKPNAKSETDSWRLCQSFVKLNSITETLSYPLPNMQRMLEDLGRHRGYVSSMDMTKSFYQIRVLPECAKLAGFVTPFGSYVPTCLLMGLKNSSQSLQRVVDQVYAPLLATGKVHCYLDDLICSTTTQEEHLRVLEAVFQRAKMHDVRYKPSKTRLLCRSVKLLGHIVTPEGVSVDDSKTRAISQIAEPTNKTEVRAFVGLANFYKRFVKGFAELARPLLTLLGKNVPFLFTRECRDSFEALKRCLCESPVLRYPDFSGKYPFHVYTDASSRALGAVLHQEFEDGSHPVAYASRVLTPSELPQPILVKESLAVIFAICEKFFYYLDGRHFILTTDNSALRYLLQATKEPKGSSRLVRDAMRLLDFDFEVRHRPGPDIPHADGLSRLSWKEMIRETEEVPVDIDLDARTRPVCAVWEIGMKSYTGEKLRAEQLKDDYLGRVIRCLEGADGGKGPAAPKAYELTEQGVLHKRAGRSGARLVVPSSLQPALMRESHGGKFGGHVGWKKMLEQLRRKYTWKGMEADLRQYLQQCPQCESRNAGFLGKAPIQDNYQATYPFQKVSIDLLTGLPATDQGNTVLLTVVDCFTRWVELIPLPSRTAKEVALALRDRVFFRHGVCDVVSDNGAELVSQIVTELYTLMGVRASTCTTYHPQAQGTVERTHRVIADMLAKYIGSGESHWDMHTASVQFAMNNSVHGSTKHTPYYLVHGRAARLPSDELLGKGEPVQWRDYHQYVEQLLRSTRRAFAEVAVNVQKAQKANQVRVNNKARLRSLGIGDEVLLHDPHTRPGEKGKLASRWKRGFVVLDKFGQVNYYIEHQKTGRRQLVHIDRLKLRRSRSDDGGQSPGGDASAGTGAQASASNGHRRRDPDPPPSPWDGDIASPPEYGSGGDDRLTTAREPVDRGEARADPSAVNLEEEGRRGEKRFGRGGGEGPVGRGSDHSPGPATAGSTSPEPVSRTSTGSETDGSDLESGSESGAFTDAETGTPGHRYARLATPRRTMAEVERGRPSHRYANLEGSVRRSGRERKSPDRYSPG